MEYIKAENRPAAGAPPGGAAVLWTAASSTSPAPPAPARGWGEKTAARETLRARDEAIYRDYRQGLPADQLAEKYFLSRKSIERIVTRMRREKQDG